ncbi:MAG: hypothetical protein P8186_01990 [Anaerolineae bacterium]
MSLQRKLVVLYHPEVFDGFYRIPISLLALAAVLEESPYRVVILDANLEPEPLRHLETLAPDALCVGMTTMPGRQTKRCSFCAAAQMCSTLISFLIRSRIVWEPDSLSYPSSGAGPSPLCTRMSVWRALL